MSTAPPTDYRFAPLVTARFVGVSLVVLAVLMFAGTALVGLAGVSGDLLLVVLLVGVAAVFTLGWLLRRPVVSLDETGYRVRMVRGAGVKQATWKQVAEATAATPRGVRCVVLKLADGGSTTIPVEVLDVDREQFVRDLQQHLRRGEGLTPL